MTQSGLSSLRGGEQRVPLLDAIRGLAVLMILLVHQFPDVLMPNRPLEWIKKVIHSGWIGVDLFFILSGLLITDILLRVRHTEGWMRVFYGRRALRIWPLYLVVLGVCFWIVPWFVRPGQDPAYDFIRSTQLYYWLHGANLMLLRDGFDGTASATLNLPHLWSLAVEEHFYLIWPLVVALVPMRRLPWVLGGIIAASLITRTWCFLTLPKEMMAGVNVQTLTRIDGLAMGALLAMYLRSSWVTRFPKLPWLALLAMAVPLTVDFFARHGLHPGSPLVATAGFTMLAVLFASLMTLLLRAPSSSLAVRLVDRPTLRFLGHYSYGIYVIHGVLTPQLNRWFSPEVVGGWIAHPFVASTVAFLCKAAISIGLAIVSWYLIEQPCLRWKRHFRYRREAQPESGSTLPHTEASASVGPSVSTLPRVALPETVSVPHVV